MVERLRLGKNDFDVLRQMGSFLHGKAESLGIGSRIDNPGAPVLTVLPAEWGLFCRLPGILPFRLFA